MRNTTSMNQTAKRMRQYQAITIIGFSVILVLLAFVLTTYIVDKSRGIMSDNAASLLSTNSKQIQINIDNYMEEVENSAALLFADKEYYLYDETDPTIEEYEKLQVEKAIADRIVDIGMMKNYADFGVVYADDHKVGWVSKTTTAMFKDGGMYDCFVNCIREEKQQDGWTFGVQGNYNRIYYVKRLNENAILMTSMYTKELDEVFEYPEELEGAVIRLLDAERNIVFSSNGEEIGCRYVDDANAVFYDDEVGVVVDDKEHMIENMNACDNGWQVSVSVPSESIARGLPRLRRDSLTMAFVVAVAFVLAGLLGFHRLTSNMGGEVLSLHDKANYDQMTKVMNKITFQNEVAARVSDSKPERYVALVMLDVDNFKQINDKLGHEYGDDVIIRMGELLRRVLGEDQIMGRLGGDEFALYYEQDNMSQEQVESLLSETIKYVFEDFLREFKKERQKCNISLSAGIVVEGQADGLSFEELYSKADQALYVSKRSGKNQLNLYREEMSKDE